MSKKIFIEVVIPNPNSSKESFPYEVVPGVLVREVVNDLKRRHNINSQFGMFDLCAVERCRVMDPHEELFYQVRQDEKFISILLPFEKTLSQARIQTRVSEHHT